MRKILLLVFISSHALSAQTLKSFGKLELPFSFTFEKMKESFSDISSADMTFLGNYASEEILDKFLNESSSYYKEYRAVGYSKIDDWTLYAVSYSEEEVSMGASGSPDFWAIDLYITKGGKLIGTQQACSWLKFASRGDAFLQSTLSLKNGKLTLETDEWNEDEMGEPFVRKKATLIFGNGIFTPKN